MRRGGTAIGIIVIVLLGIVVTGFVAYGRGETAGQKAASSDRSAFASRGTSVAGGFGGRGAGGAGFGGGGQQAGGAASAVAGKVTKVDGGTLTLQQQPGNTTATVMTDASTTVTTFASGALSDLAMGDIVALQGDKTGDTAYTAKTIYALNGAPGGAGGRGQGGTGATGTGAAGSPASGGGRNRQSGSATAPQARGCSPASMAPLARSRRLMAAHSRCKASMARQQR
jgi:hypothetical protein